MRYRVPRNIDMEDRIVGPLTMSQFIYVATGSIIIYVLYKAYFIDNPTVFYIGSIPVAIIFTSMAFLKVQEEPFPKFIVSTILFFAKPKRRVWHKDNIDSGSHVIKKTPTTPEQKSEPHQGVTKQKLNELTTLLDTSGSAAQNNQGDGLPFDRAQGEQADNSTQTQQPAANPSAEKPIDNNQDKLKKLEAIIDNNAPKPPDSSQSLEWHN